METKERKTKHGRRNKQVLVYNRFIDYAISLLGRLPTQLGRAARIRATGHYIEKSKAIPTLLNRRVDRIIFVSNLNLRSTWSSLWLIYWTWYNDYFRLKFGAVDAIPPHFFGPLLRSFYQLSSRVVSRLHTFFPGSGPSVLSTAFMERIFLYRTNIPLSILLFNSYKHPRPLCSFIFLFFVICLFHCYWFLVRV